MEKIITVKVEDYIFKVVCRSDFETKINENINIDFIKNKIHFFNSDTGENIK